MADPNTAAPLGLSVVNNLTFAELVAQATVYPKDFIVVESDTGKWKIGDGSTAYASLGYAAGGQSGPTLTTTPVSTIVINEYGDSRGMTTVLTLTDFVVGALAGAAASLGVGNICVTFPAGAHFEQLYYQSISLKCAGTAVAVDLGLGSVIASGAVSVLSGTSTFEDRLTGQATTTSSTGGTAVAALLGATAGIGTGISLNTASSVKNVFLNGAGVWNLNNTGNLTATGTIVIPWIKMSA